MSARSWAFSDDLPVVIVGIVFTTFAVAAVLLLIEVRRRERHGALIVVTGLLGAAALAAAVLRPVSVATRGSVVGARVVVLADQSRRLLLPMDRGTRRDVLLETLDDLGDHFEDTRLTVLGFGEGAPVPLSGSGRAASPLSVESDLASALASLADSPTERPKAVVVVTDGRLSRPAAGGDDESLRRAVGALGVPVHTVRVTDRAPKDASVRAVRAAGAAVAHQPLALTVEIGCGGGLDCSNVPVTVHELRQGVEPALLASGVAKVDDESGKVELTITLERAGARVVQVAIEAPDGDEIAENDTRILTFVVARERIRVLHIAGRPTYDVRALRVWLKSDESIDLVAFFILRTEADETETTSDDELALIPFPVDELFRDHLPSFDAVVLQDIDAIQYKLAQYLGRLSRYVESGGGLIMVGGPTSFAGGNYGGTALGRVLPVELPEGGDSFDTIDFSPRYTEAGRAAPVMRALRGLFGEELPRMPGANTLGVARKGSIVLWEHPKKKAGGRAMPVLALGETGDGRSIALGVDGTHRLVFSEFAASAAGRGYGALWDALLGWLMRDPRYEAARMELVGECIAGEPATLRLSRLPGADGPVEVTLERLGVKERRPVEKKVEPPKTGPIEVPLGKLSAGGYSARARIGAAPPTRFDFACERGGEAWADTRPDRRRLERIAELTGGVSVAADGAQSLPLPEATRIAAERHVSPVLPPWVWTVAAASLLGAHWIARRRGGLV